jgi:hypothetical protein
MNFAKIPLAALAGFILGAMLFHARVVKAQGNAHVYIVPLTMPDAKTPFPSNLPGVRIAGISCIAKPTAKLPDAAICYVATTLAGN